MGKEKKSYLFFLTIPLLLVLLFPLLAANSSTPQAVNQSREHTAFAPGNTLPFDPREVVKQSSGAEVIDPLVSSYTTIVDASGNQWEPRVAYNSTDNRYLVVWEDYSTDSDYHIYGQRVDADGSLLGANIQIQGMTNKRRTPDVAYNFYDNNWLVVWQEFFTEPMVSDWDVNCRVVTSNGFLGSLHGVSTYIGSNQTRPRVAYNPINNNFCVVWQDDKDSATKDWEVYSRIVAGDGTPTGSDHAVTGCAGFQYNPSIAYLPSVNGYLVVWEDTWYSADDEYDIVCKRLDKDGIPKGFMSPVSSASEDQYTPVVAANTIDKNFLVVWGDYRSYSHMDIYGQRMSSDDTPVKVGSEIAISVDFDDPRSPEVCYSSHYNRYLVAWTDYRSGSHCDIYGQLVKNDGTVEGPVSGFKISSQIGVDEVYPHLAWNSSHLNFFLVQEDNRYEATTGWDIFGRKVTYESAVLTGMGFGGKSWYKAFDIFGRRFQNVKAFGAANPNGEIDVRVADLNQDGNPEMVVAHGSGGKSWIKIFNYDGTLSNSFKCFGASNTGGQVHLAVGNFDADPVDLEIAVATGENGNNWVKVFETDGTAKASFKAYGAANTQGEVYLAATDFDEDGDDEIITGTGIGGNSLVKIFDKDGTFQSSFYAFGSENTQGAIHLAGGSFDEITTDKEIAVATGQGGTNTVKVFEQNGTLIDSFKAFGSGGNPTGSVHISSVKDGAFASVTDDILCGQGYGGSSWVKLFAGDGTFIRSFKAFGGTNANGEVYVSGSLSH